MIWKAKINNSFIIKAEFFRDLIKAKKKWENHHLLYKFYLKKHEKNLNLQGKKAIILEN